LTGSMHRMIEETNRRRQKQLEFNRRHGITPVTITKAIRESIEVVRQAEEFAIGQSGQSLDQHDLRQVLSELEEEMLLCASGLQFERAALLRDQIRELKEQYHIDGDEPTRQRSRARSRT